jgi:hypothetical protein
MSSETTRDRARDVIAAHLELNPDVRMEWEPEIDAILAALESAGLVVVDAGWFERLRHLADTAQILDSYSYLEEIADADDGEEVSWNDFVRAVRVLDRDATFNPATSTRLEVAMDCEAMCDEQWRVDDDLMPDDVILWQECIRGCEDDQGGSDGGE